MGYESPGCEGAKKPAAVAAFAPKPSSRKLTDVASGGKTARMRKFNLVWVGSVVLALAVSGGCSNDDDGGGGTAGTSGSGGSTGGSGGSMGGSGGSTGGTAGAGTGGTAGSTSGCSGATPVELTVKNSLDWCTLSVNGDAFKPDSEQMVCVAAGAVDLSAKPLNATFELGPWHHTDGDMGAGDPGTVTGTGVNAESSTIVTVGGNSSCVWICCPFVGGTGCPTTDQCP